MARTTLSDPMRINAIKRGGQTAAGIGRSRGSRYAAVGVN